MRGQSYHVILRYGHHLADAVQLDDQWGAVRERACRSPYDRAGISVERGQRVVVAGVHEDEVAVGGRRRGGAVERLLGGSRNLPQKSAVRCIEGRDDAADAEGDELAVDEEGSGFGSRSVDGGGCEHVIGCRVRCFPEDGAGCGVQGGHHFVVVPAREHEYTLADDERSGIALADLHGPLPRQCGGPGRRLDETARSPVAVASAPLRIVEWPRLRRRGRAGAEQEQESEPGQMGAHVYGGSHSRSASSCWISASRAVRSTRPTCVAARRPRRSMSQVVGSTVTGPNGASRSAVSASAMR